MRDIIILKRLVNDYDYCTRYVWDEIERNQLKEEIQHMLDNINRGILNKNDKKFITNLEKRLIVRKKV